MRHKTIIGLCAAVLLSNVSTSSAQEESEDSPVWLPELEEQLRGEKACLLLYLVNVREYRLGGREVVEAKAQCEDGRSFDVSRQEDQPLFEIRLCKPVVC